MMTKQQIYKIVATAVTALLTCLLIRKNLIAHFHNNLHLYI